MHDDDDHDDHDDHDDDDNSCYLLILMMILISYQIILLSVIFVFIYIKYYLFI
jgi:hypothetical protein